MEDPAGVQNPAEIGGETPPARKPVGWAEAGVQGQLAAWQQAATHVAMEEPQRVCWNKKFNKIWIKEKCMRIFT